MLARVVAMRTDDGGRTYSCIQLMEDRMVLRKDGNLGGNLRTFLRFCLKNYTGPAYKVVICFPDQPSALPTPVPTPR